MRVASGPDPPGSSRCVIERRKTPVPRICLSATLATPVSSGSTDTSWLCRGRLPPIPAPPETGCPQLRSPAATGTTVQVSHLHSINKRLTAHRWYDAPRGQPFAAELHAHACYADLRTRRTGLIATTQESGSSAANAQPGSELGGDLAGLVDPDPNSADGHLPLRGGHGRRRRQRQLDVGAAARPHQRQQAIDMK